MDLMSVIYFPTQNHTGYVEKLLSKIVPTLNPVIMVDLNEFFHWAKFVDQ